MSCTAVWSRCGLEGSKWAAIPLPNSNGRLRSVTGPRRATPSVEYAKRTSPSPFCVSSSCTTDANRRPPTCWRSVSSSTRSAGPHGVAVLLAMETTLPGEVSRECAVSPADDGRTNGRDPAVPPAVWRARPLPSRCGSTRDRRRRRRSPSHRCPRATSRRPAPRTSRAEARAAMRHRRSAPSSHIPTAIGRCR